MRCPHGYILPFLCSFRQKNLPNNKSMHLPLGLALWEIPDPPLKFFHKMSNSIRLIRQKRFVSAVHHGGFNCGYLSSWSKWDDYGCGYNRPFVCEFESKFCQQINELGNFCTHEKCLTNTLFFVCFRFSM